MTCRAIRGIPHMDVEFGCAVNSNSKAEASSANRRDGNGRTRAIGSGLAMTVNKREFP